MISVRIAAKVFGATPVLGDVAFDVAPGEVVTVLGDRKSVV